MKQEALSILWDIAQENPITQGDKTLFPAVREQIAAITLLAKIAEWDNEDTTELEQNNLNVVLGKERADLLAFTQFTFPSFAPAGVHQYYYRTLTDFALGRIQKLMICMPPQHGKSEGATRRLPAFLLGLNPHKRVAIVSYSAAKARKFNRELQRVISSTEYHQLFPNTRLAHDAPTPKGSWVRNADECECVGFSGGFKTLGVGGALTGEPVDILIMDDLYKDAKSAWSPTIRERISDWYETVAHTRLHNLSQQLLVMTRWHPDDLAGKLLDQEGTYHPENNPQGWHLITFPAIKIGAPSATDPRAEGEPLWPEKHALQKLLASRKRNPQVFESLYQQDPKPQEGLMYEPFTEYNPQEMLPKGTRKAYIDTADTGADYLCAICYIEADDANYVLDVLYTQKPMEQTETAVAALLKKHLITHCLVESNNGGRSFARNLERICLEIGHATIRVETFYQRAHKATRIFTYAASAPLLIQMPIGWKERFADFARDLTGYLRTGKNPHDDAPDALTGTLEARNPRKSNASDIATLFGRTL